eukprot:scaffold59920_cov61-Attheya_sp.AAC.2
MAKGKMSHMPRLRCHYRKGSVCCSHRRCSICQSGSHPQQQGQKQCQNSTNANVNTVNDVDDQYYDDDEMSMWLWICGSMVLMCLAFDVGRRGRAKRYDPVAMTNGVDGGNHFIDDEDACLT